MIFLDTIIQTDLPFIVDAYTVLHYDQEPILFTGFNRHGSRILASSVETNFNEKYDLHFYSLIDESIYHDFVTKKISYKKVLKDTGFLFGVKSSFDKKGISVYGVSYANIPDKFLPSEDSFCPDMEFKSSLEYSLKMDGQDANLHLADPENVQSISQGFIGIINDSVNSILHSSFGAKVYLGGGGFVESSFKIKLKVDLMPLTAFAQNTLFNDDPKKEYIDFIKDYVDYSLNDLGSEIEAISKDEQHSEALNTIIDKAKRISAKWFNVDEKSAADSVIEEVKNSAKGLRKISETLGEGYSTISVSNVSTDGAEHVLGYIDSGFKGKVESAFSILEAKVPDKRDNSPQSYKVYIDHLNASNRTGNAIIHEVPNVWKPKFKIKGEKPLNKTKFSESLHKKKTISVMAIATRDGITNEIKSLLIDEE